MDNRAIGVFDSGLGGLTAVRTLRRLMPHENIIYFADTARVPYGAKSREELGVVASQDIEFLLGFGVKAIVAACGTVSSNVPELISACPVPAFGVVESSARALASLPGDGPIGITATEASIRSGGYQRALRALGCERELICTPCPDFVPLIESGHTAPGDELLEAAVRRHLGEMKQAGAQAVLLGCTHFGIIAESIQTFMGEESLLVSAADCVAEELCAYIKGHNMAGGHGEERYFTSGCEESFGSYAALFLGRQVRNVKRRVLPEDLA